MCNMQNFILLQVGLDFTMIAVKEEKIKELNIHPYDLSPAAIAENDQLIIPQHPLKPDNQQQTPMRIIGPCKKAMGNNYMYSL